MAALAVVSLAFGSLFLASGGTAAASSTAAAPPITNLFVVSPLHVAVAGASTLRFTSKTPCLPAPGTLDPVVIYGFSVFDSTGPGRTGQFVLAPIDPATGNWTGQMTVGSDMPTGPHTLVAACFAGGPSGTVYQSYKNWPITVVRGGGPGVALEAATRSGQDSFLLSGAVNGNGFAIDDWYFEYGSTTAYGSRTFGGGGGTFGLNQGVVPVNEEFAGLVVGKTVHYKLVARNVNGATVSTADHQFTRPALPFVGSQPVKIDDVTVSFPTLYGQEFLKSCSFAPFFCGASNVGFEESLSLQVQTWLRSDGGLPSVYYAIKDVNMSLRIRGHTGSEFIGPVSGNGLTIDDTNVCSGVTRTFDENGKSRFVNVSYDFTRDTFFVQRFSVNANFASPTLHFSWGAIFKDWTVENGTNGFHREATFGPLATACA